MSWFQGLWFVAKILFVIALIVALYISVFAIAFFISWLLIPMMVAGGMYVMWFIARQPFDEDQ